MYERSSRKTANLKAFSDVCTVTTTTLSKSFTGNKSNSVNLSTISDENKEIHYRFENISCEGRTRFLNVLRGPDIQFA